MKTNFKNMDTQRVYISNFVKRKYNKEIKCIKCGTTKDVQIINNPDNPYSISFICKECRLGMPKQEQQSLEKINLLENIDTNKKFSRVNSLILTDELIKIVQNSVTTESTMINYLKENNLSYQKFWRAVKLYEIKENDLNITEKIQNHFNSMRIQKVKSALIKANHED